MITSEAILYYAEHPVEFVEDLLHVTPDPQQAAILRSVAANQMTSVRSGHGIGKSAVEAWAVIWFLATRPFPKNPVYGTDAAPAIRHPLGRGQQVAPQQ